MKPELLLIGGGGHCKSVIDIIEQENSYTIAGIIDEAKLIGQKVLGYDIIGCDENLIELFNQFKYALVTVGQIKSPEIRIKLFSQLHSIGYVVPAIVSPRAYVSRHATIGKGTVIMHNAMVNANAIIGDNCIINTKAIVEHDTTIENHCHLSTGATLNGNVSVDVGSFIGSGSVIKEGVAIGKECLVGMGLTVRHNLSDHTRFTGQDIYKKDSK